MSQPTRVVVAIGGNALFEPEGGNNIDPSKLEAIARQLATLVKMGFLPIITFGNGPQVGNHLDMVECYTLPPKWPIGLDCCVAWTQAEIGYALTKAMVNELKKLGVSPLPGLVEINTTVLVDPDDNAFLLPTKPIGNFYTQGAAEALAAEKGWIIKSDSNRGWRRVVPSPYPHQVLEIEAIKTLVESGQIVCCGGGGGIPVIMEDGELRGVEAVIDKDFTACLIARCIGAEQVVICTAVEQLYINFGTADEAALDTIDAGQARQYLNEGQFPPGSMGPKVQALTEFVEHGGQVAMITSLQNLVLAVQGKAGTRITAAAKPPRADASAPAQTGQEPACPPSAIQNIVEPSGDSGAA